jgi:hypothetical protein
VRTQEQLPSLFLTATKHSDEAKMFVLVEVGLAFRIPKVTVRITQKSEVCDNAPHSKFPCHAETLVGQGRDFSLKIQKISFSVNWASGPPEGIWSAFRSGESEHGMFNTLKYSARTSSLTRSSG